MAFPTTAERIASAERELGRPLPRPLHERLLRTNGGEVECEGDSWQLHPVWDDTDRRTAARTTSHVVHETKEARVWAGFPADAIAIAADGSGDRLVVRAGSEMIELWDHETRQCSPVEVDWR